MEYCIMQRYKCQIKKNDKVKVVAGKDNGKVGKVIKVDRKKGRILIENINVIKRHTRPNAQNRQGGIIESEAPIHRSNVMLLCNKCIKPVRIKMQQLDDGRKVRVCRRCNEQIDA
jgi:large subunit ribosomal protein L24